MTKLSNQNLINEIVTVDMQIRRQARLGRCFRTLQARMDLLAAEANKRGIC